MEIKAIVKVVAEQEITLESEVGAKIIIPKIMLPDAKPEQVVYLSCNLEASQKEREILNELLSNHD